MPCLLCGMVEWSRVLSTVSSGDCTCYQGRWPWPVGGTCSQLHCTRDDVLLAEADVWHGGLPFESQIQLFQNIYIVDLLRVNPHEPGKSWDVTEFPLVTAALGLKPSVIDNWKDRGWTYRVYQAQAEKRYCSVLSAVVGPHNEAC